MDNITLETAATLVAAWSSAGAAGFWLWASLTKVPPFPPIGFDPPEDLLQPIEKWARDGARRNALAAFFAFIAAIASGIAFEANYRIKTDDHTAADIAILKASAQYGRIRYEKLDDVIKQLEKTTTAITANNELLAHQLDTIQQRMSEKTQTSTQKKTHRRNGNTRSSPRVPIPAGAQASPSN